VANAIVWQDRRTAARCDSLRRQGKAALIQKKTGLVIDAYFSATKLQWLLDNVPGARARAERGELAFGTIDSWLIWNLTGGREHATDASNASRTMLFNVHTLQWDDELLRLFDIPRSVLPQVVPSSGVLGETEPGAVWRRCRLPAWRATSRPPPLARPALRPAWPRTPMAPAASC
jgi:glycerol kinase